MSKEEFKQRIISQFKDEHAPIHWVASLYENSVDDKFGQTQSVHISWVKEHRLLMKIETIGDNRHQIQFADCKKPTWGIDEFMPERYNGAIFAKESVRVKEQTIFFELKVAEMKVEDYLFSIVEPKEPVPPRIWAYDIPSRALFCCSHTGEKLSVYEPSSLKEVNFYNKGNRAIYESMSVSSVLMKSVIDGCERAVISEEEVDEILNCFSPEPWEGFFAQMPTVLNKFYKLTMNTELV